MIRETSAEAYRIIMESGLVPKSRRRIYEVLYLHGPLTQNQIHRTIGTLVRNSQSNIAARLNEMREQGITTEVGLRVDPETKMSNILWDVTINLPVGYKKPKSKFDLKLQEALEKERAACAKIADESGDFIGYMIAKRIRARNNLKDL